MQVIWECFHDLGISTFSQQRMMKSARRAIVDSLAYLNSSGRRPSGPGDLRFLKALIYPDTSSAVGAALFSLSSDCRVASGISECSKDSRSCLTIERSNLVLLVLWIIRKCFACSSTISRGSEIDFLSEFESGQFP